MEKENRTRSKIFSSNISDLIESIENLDFNNSNIPGESPLKFIRSPTKTPLQSIELKQNDTNIEKPKQKINKQQSREIKLFKSALSKNGN